MKAIIILLMVSGILLSGCSAEVPSLPQIPESSEPSSDKEPSSLPISPQPSKIAHFNISLIRYEGTITNGVTLRLAGEVRNDSIMPLKHVVAVITSYDANDNIIGIDERLINCEVLHPAETCVFSVTFNKRWGTEYCKVSFRLSEGDDILKLSREPDVPTRLYVPYIAESGLVRLLGAKHFDISLVRNGGTIWRGVVLLLGG